MDCEISGMCGLFSNGSTMFFLFGEMAVDSDFIAIFTAMFNLIFNDLPNDD